MSKTKSYLGELGIYIVDSNPGDCTHYNYIAIQIGPDNYSFAPYNSTFRFPQSLNYWSVKDLTTIDDAVLAIAKLNNCNPNTVMECIRTVREMHDEYL